MPVLRIFFCACIVLYFSASLSAQTINWQSTGGNTTTTDKVGIGTTTPSSILELSSPAPVLTIRHTDPANYGSIYFLEATNLVAALQFVGSAYAPFPTVQNSLMFMNLRPGPDIFYTNSAERMRIASDGKVGIGVTNPSEQLSVAGKIQTSGGVVFPDGLQTSAYPFNTTTSAADLNRSVAGPLTSSVTNTSSSGSANLAAIAGNGISYLRLASNETPATRDWRVGMMDSTGIFRIRNAAGTDLMTINGSAIHFNGNVDGTTVQATYQDVAEWVPTAKAMVAGTVVVVDEDADNTVTTSTHAYDTSVAGVVSQNPGLLLGVASASKSKIATTGRVRVRVDATKSPIRKGDLLVTSDRPGMAMKSEPLDLGGIKIHRPGTLIGKALEPLPSGEGEILVLLSLQ